MIHAGGVSGPMVLADQPMRVMAISVAGSLMLLEPSPAVGVRRFVHCPSWATIGPYEGALPADDAPMQPDSPYGTSKAAADEVLRGPHGRVPMELCALRLTSVYGPGRRTGNALTLLVVAAMEGRAVRVLPGSAVPLLFVEDAAVAAVAACFATAPRQLFYGIAYPEMVALEDIAAALATCGAPVAVTIDPALRAGRRGPVPVVAARRDLGWETLVDHWEGGRRMVVAARG